MIENDNLYFQKMPSPLLVADLSIVPSLLHTWQQSTDETLSAQTALVDYLRPHLPITRINDAMSDLCKQWRSSQPPSDDEHCQQQMLQSIAAQVAVAIFREPHSPSIPISIDIAPDVTLRGIANWVSLSGLPDAWDQVLIHLLLEDAPTHNEPPSDRQDQPPEVAQETNPLTFQQAAEQLPGLYVVYDAGLRIQFMNRAARMAIRHTNQSYIGKTLPEVDNRECIVGSIDHLQAAWDTGKVQRFQMKAHVYRRDVDWLVEYVPIFDRAGVLQQVVCTATDITDIVRTQAQQAEVGERLSILRGIDQGILTEVALQDILHDALHKLRHRFACDWAGFVEADFSRRTMTILASTHAFHEGIPYPMQRLHEIVNWQPAYNIYLNVFEKTKEPSAFEQTLVQIGIREYIDAPVDMEDLQGLLALGWQTQVSSDVFEEQDFLFEVANALGIAIQTHRLRARIERQTEQLERTVRERTRQLALAIENLQDSQRLLRIELDKEKEVSDLKTRFIAMATHEFKTPLAKMQLAADTLRRKYDVLTEEQRVRFLGRLTSGVEEITLLLDDVLTVGSERNRMRFEPEPLALAAFLAELVETYISVHQVQHPIQTLFAQRAQPFHADPRLLQTIINNLLSNAVKYSPPEQSITVRLAYADEWAVIDVIDQGIGIPATDQDALFDAFHRAANVGNIEGMGLGLAIIKMALERHNATIDFVSELNVGTTFTVKIPGIHPPWVASKH